MAGKRGRKPGFKMTQAHRDKIKNSNILNALVEHVEGKREMSSTQVTAGVALLKKVMPDLSSVDMNATLDDKRTAADWTRDELVGFLTNQGDSGGGASEEDGRDRASDSVH